MAKLLKLRRGTTSDHSSFTGAEGEVTVDTTKDSLVVHDGSTAGGHPIAKSSDIPSVTGKADLTGATFTGNVLIDNAKELRLGEADGSGTNFTALKAQAQSADITLTLPAVAPTANQVLKADGSTPTTLTWAADAGTDSTKVAKAGGDTITGTHTYDSNGNVVINGSLDYNGSGNATFTNLAVESDLWCTNNSGLALYETSGNGSNKITVKSPAAVTADVTLTLPDGDGNADEFLQTDGSGVLSWGTSSSGATGGGSDAIFVENSQTVTTSYSITSNKNAHSVGPISINNNIVVTIPANSTWLVS